MKKIIFIWTLLISFNCVSQPDPDIFQTWYLIFVQSSDAGTPYFTSDIEPPIAPYLIVSENSEFNGEGACNTFNGTVDFPGPNSFETTFFESTMNDCTSSIHNSFEDEYFWFMESGGSFDISKDGTGLELTMSNPIFGQAIFKNYLLSTTEFNSIDINVYPNPVSSELFIQLDGSIERIEVVSIDGYSIKVIKPKSNKIELSDLSSGIYFLKIFTDKGTGIKKIIRK